MELNPQKPKFNDRPLLSIPDLDWVVEERKLKRALLPLKIWLGFFSLIALFAIHTVWGWGVWISSAILLIYLHRCIKQQVLSIRNGQKYWATIISQKEAPLGTHVWVMDVQVAGNQTVRTKCTMPRNQRKFSFFEKGKWFSSYKNWPKVGDKIGVYYWEGYPDYATPICEFEKTS